MAKVKCSRGHIYDSAIYGDNCPFCPSGTVVNDAEGSAKGGQHTGTQVNSATGTMVNEDGKTQPVNKNAGVGVDPTIQMGSEPYNGGPVGGTVIRPAGGSDANVPNGRRVVAVLTSYDINPLGEVYKIYEGRNYIGRDITSDVCLSSDSQISGKHVSILYRSVDNKFKFKDEQSSNGTFVNNTLEDEGELSSFDVIKIGDTNLIFIAIPQIFNQ